MYGTAQKQKMKEGFVANVGLIKAINELRSTRHIERTNINSFSTLDYVKSARLGRSSGVPTFSKNRISNE